jgi:hypothetical protein
MYRLRFTNEADGDRASRGGPRPPLVHLSALPKGVQRHIIDSTVTEAWVEPRRGAVTYEIHNGCMIPKPVRVV